MSHANGKPIPLAKPTGVTLGEHIRNLIAQAELLFKSRSFVLDKYRKFTGEDFASAIRDSAQWHDAGKKHPHWQDCCQRDFEIFRQLPESQKKKFRAKNLQKVPIRHELASLEFMHQESANVSLPVRVGVAAHHSKLSRRDKHKQRWLDKRYPEFERFWQEFTNLDANIRRTSFSEVIKQRYRFAGVRAWLQLVDHRASAFEQNEELPKFFKFDYTFPYTEKRGVQKVIEELWDEPFAILRAPTGAGKTDAALLWAQRQIEQSRADRIIFAMPTRFTANALSISKVKDLSALGLYHSSAWYKRREGQLDIPDDMDKLIDKEQELARKLEMPCVVTTVDHLCLCLTGTREDHHAIFFGLAHSCVVIDEADFYDDFTQANIVLLLRVLKLLEVPVLLMSATVPESARGVYKKSSFDVQPIFEDRTDYEKPRCKIVKYGKAEEPEDVAELLQRALDGEPLIIYTNTVERAQAYYRWFQRNIWSGVLNLDDIVLYHSRFIEPHKLKKEERLTELIGKDAWKENRARGVAILTQIGEISVNISADIMISDLCPLDRLAQRAGRLSRFNERGDGRKNVVGELFVMEPQKFSKKTFKAEFYPAPYGEYQNGWQASEFLLRSRNLLFEGEYSAKSFVDLVNQLYPNVPEIKVNVRENQKKLNDLILNNWLILPAEEVKEDQEETLHWQCRNIPPQSTIYIEDEASNIWDDDSPRMPTNKTELRQWQIRHGINIHAYEFHNARKPENNFLVVRKFNFGYEREIEIEMYIVRRGFYNENLGLNWEGISDDY
ncbi:MAG: CRISPR-associated helicase Cas3' [Blastocatellia bacterium]